MEEPQGFNLADGLEGAGEAVVITGSLLTISSKLFLAPGGDSDLVLGREVEQEEDLARSSEQGSEPEGRPCVTLVQGKKVYEADFCLVAQNGDCTLSRSPLDPHTSPDLPCAAKRQTVWECRWVALPSRAE